MTAKIYVKLKRDLGLADESGRPMRFPVIIAQREAVAGLYYRAVRLAHFGKRCVRICKTALCHLGTAKSIELADWRRLTIWTAASLDSC